MEECNQCFTWIGGYAFDGSIASGVVPCETHRDDAAALQGLDTARRLRVDEVHDEARR